MFYLETPIGRISLDESLTRKYKDMTAEEVWNLLKKEEEKTGLIDPILFSIWAQKDPVGYERMKQTSLIYKNRNR